MASIAIKNVHSAQLAATSAALYTCPANTKARVVKCTVCNDTTTVPTYSFWKVPSGSSADNTTLVVNARNLPSKESWSEDRIEGQILEAGDAIHAQASGADQVTVMLDVAEIVE